MIALVFARLAYRGRPDMILRVGGYLQGCCLALFAFIMRAMGMEGAGALLALACVASLMAAVRIHRELLYPAATLLMGAAFGWQAIEQPEKVRIPFLLIN